jgi:hypothetical protein
MIIDGDEKRSSHSRMGYDSSNYCAVLPPIAPGIGAGQEKMQLNPLHCDAPNQALERTFTRLHALTGGILVPVAQRHHVMERLNPMKYRRKIEPGMVQTQ